MSLGHSYLEILESCFFLEMLQEGYRGVDSLDQGPGVAMLWFLHR